MGQALPIAGFVRSAVHIEGSVRVEYGVVPYKYGGSCGSDIRRSLSFSADETGGDHRQRPVQKEPLKRRRVESQTG